MPYSEKVKSEFKEIIINEMISGKSLSRITRENKDKPSIRTVFDWLNPESKYHDKEFLHNYARAQQIRAENEFEEIKEIADSTEHDVTLDSDGNAITNHNIIQRDRLRVDARKWRISKMSPKKYGDKLDLTTGGDKIEKPEITLNYQGEDLDLSN